jgi:hypothetical protein
MRYMLFVLHALLGLNAAAGGFLMMIKPDGSLLKMNSGLLTQSPFSNFFLPGLLLFTCIGLLSLLSLSGLLFRYHSALLHTLNLYPERHWAWTFSLYTGIGTIIWIGIQLFFIPYFWLQPVILFTATGILICTLFPGVMKYYEIKRN